MPRILEVCVASVDSAVAAAAGGADRIELNRALSLDGLTPGLDLFLDVRSTLRDAGHGELPIVVMIRPHDRGFVYDGALLRAMVEDAARFVDAGAAGLVFGPLREDGTIDPDGTARLVESAAGRTTVFHRAFDRLSDHQEGMSTLVRLGIDRVLTSGGAATALEGAPSLARLRRLAAGRIEVLPGGGVTPDTIPRLVEVTGCDQVHGTFKRAPRPGEVEPATDPAIVVAARRALDRDP